MGSTKEPSYIAKHGIAFPDAMEIFTGQRLERTDNRIDYGEDRLIAYGECSGRVVVVVYTWRGERRRIVSARRAKKAEANLHRGGVWQSAKTRNKLTGDK